MNQRSEYKTQGTIQRQGLGQLLHRLRGLCDRAADGGTRFREHEMFFKISGSISGSTPAPVSCRIRRSLNNERAPWHLRYYGPADTAIKSPIILVRNCIELTTTDALPQFLQEMGFVLQQECVFEGWLFLKGPFKVCVFSISKMPVRSDTTNTEEIPAMIVDVTATAVAGVEQDAVVHEMNSLAEHLKPLVMLKKPDPALPL
ncbi:mediator of RNA polymerase II transcription subunit 18-like [Corticium candelabrum]|uniref:mediator of RNA polymerase II transcription subunit 18-like n=1 Tax=Corticium candelabrum TaxID=121492 RepID=UPI002E2754E4|nr:mediator of RNA polymerase II transcription subunit 18-like [Corticium candelabrum]